MSIVHDNGRTAEVTIRFSEKDGYYFFNEFTAATLLLELPSGKISIIEYRIPEYTYHVNVPIDLPGLNDAGIKPWDKLFAKLSKADQEGWYALFGEKDLWSKGIEEQLKKGVVAELKRRFPTMKIDEKNVDNMEFTPEQKLSSKRSLRFLDVMNSSPSSSHHRASPIPQSS